MAYSGGLSGADELSQGKPGLWWNNYRVAQKSKLLPNYQKIVLNRVKACHWDEIYYQIKVWIKHYIIGIRYSMRDLLSDLNNYAWPATIVISVRYGKW